MKRRAGDKRYVSNWCQAKYKYFAFIFFSCKTPNFIVGDFANKQIPFDKAQKTYVFLYLVVCSFYFILNLF